MLNLLTWPLSMLWDPISGYDGAKVINYQASVAHARRQQLRGQSRLRHEHKEQRIDDRELVQGLREINEKYAY